MAGYPKHKHACKQMAKAGNVATECLDEAGTCELFSSANPGPGDVRMYRAARVPSHPRRTLAALHPRHLITPSTHQPITLGDLDHMRIFDWVQQGDVNALKSSGLLLRLRAQGD